MTQPFEPETYRDTVPRKNGWAQKIFGSYAGAFLASGLMLLGVLVFVFFLRNPAPDGYIVVVTSEFAPDAKFEKEVAEAFSLYAPDINVDGARRMKVFCVCTGPAVADQRRVQADTEKVQKLLDNQTPFLLISDTETAQRLIEDGICARSKTDEPGVGIPDTSFYTPYDRLLVESGKAPYYRGLLAEYRLTMPRKPVGETDGSTLARQYIAAKIVYDGLTSGRG